MAEVPKKHRIESIDPGSIAEELGIKSGDLLLEIDGKPVIDVFDYRFRQLNSHLILSLSRQGTLLEYDIEKDENEDLGLNFTCSLMDACRCCQNHCVFCFVDQLPNHMRSSLYVKDDDVRLSFLNGQYATLTNIPDEELDRLIGYRLSPMNISVHATDPELRKRMLRNRKAGLIMDQLRRIANAGIEINTQIVLCPGINDGYMLEKTIKDLVSLGDSLKSIALVPVGLTRYRPHDDAEEVRPFTKHEAQAVVNSIKPWQRQMRHERGRSLIYLADEFYNLSDRPWPPAEWYDDFPQLENGVGLVALFQKELSKAVKQLKGGKTEPVWHVDPSGSACEPDLLSKDKKPVHILVTGKAAEPVLKSFQAVLERHSGCPVMVQSVTNRFFGETVTVAGLLTGQDVVAQLREVIQSLREDGFEPNLFFPAVLFKAREPVTLDGMSLNEISQQLSVPAWVLRPSGKDLAGILSDVCRSVKRS